MSILKHTTKETEPQGQDIEPKKNKIPVNDLQKQLNHEPRKAPCDPRILKREKLLSQMNKNIPITENKAKMMTITKGKIQEKIEHLKKNKTNAKHIKSNTNILSSSLHIPPLLKHPINPKSVNVIDQNNTETNVKPCETINTPSPSNSTPSPKDNNNNTKDETLKKDAKVTAESLPKKASDVDLRVFPTKRPLQSPEKPSLFGDTDQDNRQVYSNWARYKADSSPSFAESAPELVTQEEDIDTSHGVGEDSQRLLQPKTGIPSYIKVDERPHELHTFDGKAYIFLNGVYREIYLKGMPVNVMYVDSEELLLNFGETKEIWVDGIRHCIRLGFPTRELWINDVPYEVKFGDPPRPIRLGTGIHTINLRGPPPAVKLRPEAIIPSTSFQPIPLGKALPAKDVDMREPRGDVNDLLKHLDLGESRDVDYRQQTSQPKGSPEDEKSTRESLPDIWKIESNQGSWQKGSPSLQIMNCQDPQTNATPTVLPTHFNAPSTPHRPLGPEPTAPLSIPSCPQGKPPSILPPHMQLLHMTPPPGFGINLPSLNALPALPIPLSNPCLPSTIPSGLISHPHQNPSLFEQRPPLPPQNLPFFEQRQPLPSQIPPHFEQRPSLSLQNPPLLEKKTALPLQKPPLFEQRPPLLPQNLSPFELRPPFPLQNPLLFEQRQPLPPQNQTFFEQRLRQRLSQNPPRLEQRLPLPLQNLTLFEQRPPLPSQNPPLLEQRPPLPSQNPPLLEQRLTLPPQNLPPLPLNFLPLQQKPPLLEQKPPLLEQKPTFLEQKPQPTPPVSVDINILFDKLVNSGMISKPPSFQNPCKKLKVVKKKLGAIELDPKVFKVKHPLVISQLHSGKQCSSCSLRIRGSLNYKEHLDWHFRTNRREKDSQKKAFNRRWYYSKDDWYNYVEFEDPAENQPCFFEDEPARSPEPIQVPTVLAPTDDSQNLCSTCGDRFDVMWQEDLEEWHLSNALCEGELYFHPLCLEDYKQEEKRRQEAAEETQANPEEIALTIKQEPMETDVIWPEHPMEMVEHPMEMVEHPMEMMEHPMEMMEHPMEMVTSGPVKEETEALPPLPSEEPSNGDPKETQQDEELVHVVEEAEYIINTSLDDSDVPVPTEGGREKVVLGSGGLKVKVRPESIVKPPTPPASVQQSEDDTDELEFAPPALDPRFPQVPPVFRGEELTGLCSLM